ncbi:MogA/MoaB family molybdenum cofactor biosynthesis protein, partial [Streptomyces sp. DT7]
HDQGGRQGRGHHGRPGRGEVGRHVRRLPPHRAGRGGRVSAPARDSPGYRALVVTASNRAAAGVYADKGGPLIAEALTGLGFTVDGPRVVPDGDPVAQA